MKRIILVILLIGIAIWIYFFRDLNEDQTPPHEEDPSHIQAVVSLHELATESGFEVLEKGGTAADAAITVASVLSVVEPWFSSVVGGGTWALYYEAESGQVTSLDAVGPAGSKASLENYSSQAHLKGVHQTIVPGAWDGWMLWLERYGVLELEDVLNPAIEIARNGYPASSQMDFWINNLSEEILSRPDASAIYAPQGQLISQGDTVYQHNLADTFERLNLAYNENRDGGRFRAIQAARDYYYRGPLAEEIVEFSNRNDGYLTLDDFHNFEAEIVEPISIHYNNEVELFQNPPNSQGITMLLALNILKDYDFADLNVNDVDVLHLEAEAIKLAFADRYYHVGDPNRVEIPVKDLLSSDHRSRQVDRIDMERAMSWPIADILEKPQDSHTTTFHITDRWGNAAAVTTSLGAEFIVAGDTGIHLNNRMRMFSLQEGNPNQIVPGYKVRHTSNPYMALYNGKPYILGGNTGVDSQPQGQMQQFLSVIEFGLTAQEAIDRPRIISTAFPAGSYPHAVKNTLQMESGLSQEVIDGLRQRGHDIRIGEGIFGSANMIVITADGRDADIGVESRVPVAKGIKNLP